MLRFEMVVVASRLDSVNCSVCSCSWASRLFPFAFPFVLLVSDFLYTACHSVRQQCAFHSPILSTLPCNIKGVFPTFHDAKTRANLFIFIMSGNFSPMYGDPFMFEGL